MKRRLGSLLVVAGLAAAATACSAPPPATPPSATAARGNTGASGADLLAAAKRKATVHVEVSAANRAGETIAESVVDLMIGATQDEYRARSVATVDGRALETRVVDGSCYVRALGTGQGFAAVADDCPLDIYHFDFDALASEFAAVKSALAPKGSEELDGVTATAYTVSQEADGASKTVWVGADDLPRKVEITLANGVTGVYLYTRWGEGVTVEAPSPSEMAG